MLLAHPHSQLSLVFLVQLLQTCSESSCFQPPISHIAMVMEDPHFVENKSLLEKKIMMLSYSIAERASLKIVTEKIWPHSSEGIWLSAGKRPLVV